MLPPGGTWSSSNTAIATAGSLTGAVCGVAAGSVTITYTLGTTCFATYDMVVNPGPNPITGGAAVLHGLYPAAW